MTLSDLASLGSFGSGVAVLVSLIFLSLLVRQAHRYQRGLSRSTRAHRMVEAQLAATEAGLAEALSKGLAGAPDITPVQFGQFMGYCRASFYNAEDTYFQHKDGLLSDAAFESYAVNVRGWAAAPGMRAAWRQCRDFFVPEFAGWIDAQAAAVTPAIPGGFARWRADLAAESVQAAAQKAP
jgi:hypothetical protein